MLVITDLIQNFTKIPNLAKILTSVMKILNQ